MRKSKEEDRIEKIIRGLLKLPENRRCINCNSLGPQYVCTTFWTFICTNCSGVHREFTHRVKSVSMAKFSSEEVSALQAGGNERAREVYFKTWDLQRHSFPDSSNLHRLRDFIKNVYVDRKYTGARHPAFIPRSKMSERDGPYERRSNNAVSESHGLCERNDERHSRFCDDRNSRYSSNDKNIRYCYDDRTSKYSYDRNGRHLYDDRNNRHSYDEGRSPSYSRDSSLSGGLRRSCSLFEVTSERHHDEDPRTPKTPKTPTEMFTTNDINPRRSNYRQKDKDISSPPPIRPVRDILGESFARLRAEDSPKLSDKRSVDGSVHAWVSDHSRSTYTKSTGGSSSIEQTGDSSKTTIKGDVDGSSCSQKTAPSSSEASGKGDAEKCTPTKSQSLIDFPANPSPLDSSVAQETQQTAMLNDAGNSASLESPAKEKPSPAPPKNTLEFLLFELSTPADASPDKEFRDSSSDSAATMAPPTCTPVSTRISHTTPKGQVLALPSTSITPSTILCPAAGGLRVAPTSSGSTASASTVAHLLALPAPVSSTSTPTPNPSGDEPKTLTIEMSQDPQDDSGGSTNEEANRHQFPSMHLAQHAANSVPCSQTLSQQTFPSSGVAKNPSGIFSSAPISQEHPGLASAQSCQSLSNPAQPQGGTRLSSLEAKSSERKELPADIFTSLYPSVPQPMPGWQMGPNYGMGFNMQYGPSSMQVQAFPNAAKSTNPFDISDDTTELQTSVFPSMASLQGLLPNVSAPSGRPPISSFGSDPTGTQSPSFMTGMDPRSPVYGTVASPGAFMGQHLYMPPFRPQGVGDFSNGETSGLLNQNHQAEFQYSSSTNPSSFPRGGGNPFG